MVSGGIARCENCGMEYSQECIKEKLGANTDNKLDTAVAQNNLSSMTENWMRMGMAAEESENYQEAYIYFNKVVEVDPDNWEAIFHKGNSAAWQSTIAYPRLEELYYGVNTALEIVSNQYADVDYNKVWSARLEFASAIFSVNCALVDLVYNNIYDYDELYYSHVDLLCSARQQSRNCIDAIEMAIALIDDNKDYEFSVNIMRKRLCRELTRICGYFVYWIDYSQSDLLYFGLTDIEKKPYIEKFKKLVYEIRRTESSFSINGSEYRLNPFDSTSVSIFRHKDQEIINYWVRENKKYADEMNKRHRTEFLRSNPEKDKEYKSLEEEYRKISNAINTAKQKKNKVNSSIESAKAEKTSLTEQQELAKRKIEKLSKKIFGKTKALEEISNLKTDITQMEIKSQEYSDNLPKLQAEEKKCSIEIEQLKKDLAVAKNNIQNFCKRNGIVADI